MPALVASVAELVEQVKSHHARAQARERVIDHLHDEVERLRRDERGALLRPLAMNLHRLRDELLEQSCGLPETIDRAQVGALLESFALTVEQSLEGCGYQPVRPEIGAAFTPKEHRAAKVVAAAAPDEHDTVALVVSDGYLEIDTGRVSVPARVHVRRWEQPKAIASDHADPVRKSNDAPSPELGEHRANV